MIQETDAKTAQKTVDVPITREILEDHAVIGPMLMPTEQKGRHFASYDFYTEDGNVVDIKLYNNEGDIEEYPKDQYPCYAEIPSAGRVYTMDAFFKTLMRVIEGMNILKTTPVEVVEVNLPEPVYTSDSSDSSDGEEVINEIGKRFVMRPRVAETTEVLYPVQ